MKTGLVRSRVSAEIAKLQKYREQADYSESFVLPPDLATQEVELARTLAREILLLLPADP